MSTKTSSDGSWEFRLQFTGWARHQDGTAPLSQRKQVQVPAADMALFDCWSVTLTSTFGFGRDAATAMPAAAAVPRDSLRFIMVDISPRLDKCAKTISSPVLVICQNLSLLETPLERSQLAVRMLSGVALLKIQQQFPGATTRIDLQL